MTVQNHSALIPAQATTSLLDPEPLARTGNRITRWIGPVVSLLILGAVLYQFRHMDRAALWRLLPVAPMFWIAFALYYMAAPLSELAIFRRLWNIPTSGLGALLRKQVSNEILLGYLGEVYFYAWARRNAQITAAPFGAIKDVTILSALTGNIVTLIMVMAAAPLFISLHVGTDSKEFLWSILFVLGTSAIALLARNRLFALPRNELWFVAGVHLLRIIATTVLAAIMWHLLLPSVSISWWLLLATLRILVSRLPLLPNKDLVFAGLAVFFVGKDTEIVTAMALMASLILAAHLAVGAMLGASEIFRESRA